MSTPNPKHQDFISLLRQTCKSGASALADLAVQVNQYNLIYASGSVEPLTVDDFAGSNSDIGLIDIANAVNAFSQVNAVLSASGNAGWIAAYKVGR